MSRSQPLDALGHVQQERDGYLDEIARLRAEGSAARDEVEQLREALEQSEEMRGWLRFERDGLESVRKSGNAYLIGEREALREQAYLDIVRYGRHEDGCAVLTLFPQGGPLSMPCSCGFAQARERWYPPKES